MSVDLVPDEVLWNLVAEAQAGRLNARDMKVLMWQREWQLSRREKQTPPPDPWSEWGLLAGRGFGKSLTAAQWIAIEAVTDTEALPSAVIAPTLNDIRYTCFEGHTGILSIIPAEIIKDYNKTNLIITLDNGATIRGFSAEEPERLRGPQFARVACFVAGTMVSTPDGVKAIESLRAGDLVVTRKGARRVLANSKRRAAVGEVEFSNSAKLVGTADHPLYLESGWTRLDQLQIGDKGCVIGASSGAESSGTSMAMGRPLITSAPTRRSNQKPDVSIARCGLTPTDRFRKVLISTTRITSRATRSSKTWSAFQKAVTGPTTSWLNRFLERIGAVFLESRVPVLAAGYPSFENGLGINIAAVNATPNGLRKSAVNFEFAENAEQNSSRSLETFVASVVSTWRPAGEQSVFCLKVDDAPEYFANGLLVHNCDEIAAWAQGEETWDMMMMGLRLGPHPKVVWTTTPKPKELILRLVEPKPGRVITSGTTYENRANLPQSFFDQLAQYEGTQLGRQELLAEIIDAEEGGIVARSWIRCWPHDKPLPAFTWILMSLDTAFTEKTIDRKSHDPDPTACGVFGVFEYEDRSNVILLDAWEAHMGFPDLIKRTKKELKATYGPDRDAPMIKPMFGPKRLEGAGKSIDLVIIEDKGSGISLRQALEREGISAYAYNPGNADKAARLHMVSHLFNNRQIWVPGSGNPDRRGQFVTWADKAVAQLCAYRGAGSIKHDDFVDVFSQALRVCMDKGLLTTVPRTRQIKAEKEQDEKVAARGPRINPYAV